MCSGAVGAGRAAGRKERLDPLRVRGGLRLGWAEAAGGAHALVEQGNSSVVIEQNLEVIKVVD